MKARRAARSVDAEEAVREAKFARAGRKRNLLARSGATLQFTELGFGAAPLGAARERSDPGDRGRDQRVGGHRDAGARRPFNSGILAFGAKRGARCDDRPASSAVLVRVRRIKAICKTCRVKLAEAALRFRLSHPAIVSVIPGGQKPGEVRRNAAMLDAQILSTLWRALKAEGLMRPDAPTPR